jgi:hypothetical protein
MNRTRLSTLIGTLVATLGLGARGSPCGTCPDAEVEVIPVLLSGADAGDAGDAGEAGTWTPDDHPSTTECNALCGYSQTSCRKIVTDGGVPAVECTRPAECGAGRKPEGLIAEHDAGMPADARWWSEIATLEAAAVDAFVRLRAELHAHGAPRKLLRRASRAVADERRHARATRSFARAAGARPRRHRVAPFAPRALEAIARENAVEGCVGETWGALVAAVQAKRARTPELRAAFARIAREELQHAELSRRVATFVEARLTNDARARVRIAREAAARRVASEPLGPATSSRSLAAVGLPAHDEARALATALFRGLGYLHDPEAA